jgi:uncharacterized protein (UPF0248 family)
MELQVEKYSNLIKSLSKMANRCKHYTEEDFSQELWKKLYEFIKTNSGEADNFPLIKSALRNHLLDLIRDHEIPLNKVVSIEDLIFRGVDLVYRGFGPYENAELKEIRSFINEWFQKQNDDVKKFMMECMLEMDDKKVPIHRVEVKLKMSQTERVKIITSLRKFLKSKGVEHVY